MSESFNEQKSKIMKILDDTRENSTIINDGITTTLEIFKKITEGLDYVRDKSITNLENSENFIVAYVNKLIDNNTDAFNTLYTNNTITELNSEIDSLNNKLEEIKNKTEKFIEFLKTLKKKIFCL